MLTLREILDWEILSGHTVIAGAGSLGSEVLSVTVIDAPDAVNWVKAREFVVTSTYPVQQSPQALVALIEQLAARNAAGLGVKLTRFLREFPDDARCRADELGLPIVSLPGPLAWSDLIGRVFADGDRQSSQAAHLSAIYRGFSQHRARLGSLRELFDLVTGFVNLPVVLAVEDEMGLRIESRGVSSAEAEGLAETLIHGEATGTHPQDTPLRLTVGSETVAVARTGMSANGGGLVAIVERAQTASDADLECLRLSVHLLQTLLDANIGAQSHANGDARLLSQLLDPLLSGEAKQLLAARGLPDAARWHLVVGRIFDAGTLDQALLSLRLRQFARRRLALLRMEDDDGGCTIAIPATDADARSEDAALREFSQIFERQARRASDFRYGLGQAGPATLPDAAELYREAREAMAFGVSLNGFNRLSRHDDLLLMRLLAHPAVIEESRASFLRLLDPLLAMGEQGRMLIKTLRVWFQEDESMPRTAERLGLHVNTVRQRLDRSRAALRLTDLGTDTRLRLYVALQLLPMLRPGES
jgi:purine catabolism regulator